MSTSDGNDVDWDAVGYISSGSYRLTVMQALEDTAATPTKLEEETGIEITHVSRALHRLRDRGLVELLVPDDQQKGRLYALTEKGAQVLPRAQGVTA